MVWVVRIYALPVSVFSLAIFTYALLPLRFIVAVSRADSAAAVDSVKSRIALANIAVSNFIGRACQNTFSINFFEAS